MILFAKTLLSFQLTYTLVASDKVPAFEEESSTLPFRLNGTPCRISCVFDFQPTNIPYSFLVSLINIHTGETLKSRQYEHPRKSQMEEILSFDFHNHEKIDTLCRVQIKIENGYLDKIKTKEVNILTVGNASSFLFSLKDGSIAHTRETLDLTCTLFIAYSAVSFGIFSCLYNFI